MAAATLLLLFTFVSCSNAGMEEKMVQETANADQAMAEQMAAAEAAATDTVGSYSSSAPAVKVPDKIIKTADISFRVEDYVKSRIEIDRIIKSCGGYIGQENEQNNSYNIANNIVIRVPNAGFDSLVGRLVTVAIEVTNKSVNTQDVTAQFVDIQTRLKTKKEIEQRYIQLLSKATKISDILEIEEKIRVIREEIEAKEGELKYMSDRVSYSTINLNFYQAYEYQPSDRPGFFNRLASAFGSGWKGLLEFIIGFVNAWPVWLVLSLLGWGTWKLIKRLTRISKNKPVTANNNSTIN